MRLHDRTAIITGASMGIGAATAVELARKGAHVFAVARNDERLQSVADLHPNITPIVADVTIEDDRTRIIEHVGEEAGGADILVNNAGHAAYGLLETMSPQTIRNMFELNVMSMVDMCQRVLPRMLLQRSGHICNIGSSISYVSAPPMTMYAATKFAVEGFTDGLRREVFGRGVGVSLIQPGPVKTGFWDRALSGDSLDVDEKSGTGIPAEWVATAIYKAIRFDHVPGYATVGVPRGVGLGRLLDVPGVSYALDWASVLMQRAPMPMVSRSDDDADVIPLHRNDER